jgi:3-dehydroquinate synthase II
MSDLDRVALFLDPPTAVASGNLRDRATRRGFQRFARRTRGGYRVDGLPAELRVRSVDSPSGLDAAVHALRRGELLLLSFRGDRVIPLENAVAALGGQHPLGVVVETPEDVPAAIGALERGADLVVVHITGAADLGRLEELTERPRGVPLRWATARVERIEPVGLSERVLVDTTRMLRPDAGLLLGSSAQFLFSVVSEATGSAFSRPRPFRINAGSPHSYTLMADGSTRYLSELEAGDRVLIARPGGIVESARVGRLKIERRPMVLIRARVGALHPTIFLQEAETVRLSSAGRAVAVTEMVVGDRVKGVELPAARHLGRAIDEGVEER